jgi:hypothetical protein
MWVQSPLTSCDICGADSGTVEKLSPGFLGFSLLSSFYQSSIPINFYNYINILKIQVLSPEINTSSPLQMSENYIYGNTKRKKYKTHTK